MNKNVHTFLGCDADYEQSRIVLFGAPFDSTTSFRPGARFGCAAMRQESVGLETYSPYQDRDLCDAGVFDGGDLDLVFGSAQKTLEQIRACTEDILRDGKLPVMMGGEHLVTLGAMEAVVKKYPEVRVIHLDAHADLRDDYMGEKLSHATVMRRVWELVGDGHIYQLGIRSGEKTEFAFAGEHTELHPFALRAAAQVAAEVADSPVYLSIDLDVLDCGVFPGTGTPEAGGATFRELLEALLHFAPLHIVGCDVVELAPMLDSSGASTATACKVLRELLLLLRH